MQVHSKHFWGELMKILISTGIICDLISEKSQTCWILKTKYYFYNFRQLEKI